MDWALAAYSTVIFTLIGAGLTGIILICRAIFSPKGMCTITINGDPSRTKVVPAGQTLLNALTSSGIPIPSPCGGRATCKQCRVCIVEQADDPLETDISTFSKKQLQEGWRLSCQVRLRHDLSVHIDERHLNVKEWKATVVSNDNVATFIKELVVHLPEGDHIDYRPGGYLQITIPPFKTNTDDWKATIAPHFFPDWDKYQMFGRSLDFSNHPEEHRAYSLGSYPAEGERLLFDVRIATPPFEQGKLSTSIPWGFGSSYLFSLKAGDTIHGTGPYGESFMRDGETDVYFLIGGAGASFGRSHVFDVLTTKKTHRRVSMWYGARSMRENIYQRDYEQLAREHENFSYHLVLSEPTREDIAAGWPMDDPTKTGFLFKAFEQGQLKRMKAPEAALYFVCGPPMHNKSVMKLLDDYGVSRDNIVLDDFGS